MSSAPNVAPNSREKKTKRPTAIVLKEARSVKTGLEDDGGLQVSPINHADGRDKRAFFSGGDGKQLNLFIHHPGVTGAHFNPRPSPARRWGAGMRLTVIYWLLLAARVQRAPRFISQ